MNESEERTGLGAPHVPSQTLNGADEEEPPGKPRRHPLWRDVPETQWNDWRWQSQNAIRSVRQLRNLLPFSQEELEAIGSLETQYKLAIPPYYFSLIHPENPQDPIRLQSVTSPLEMQSESGYELEDPLEEDEDSPVPGLTHRYPDRVLLITTHVCTMYCRFCTLQSLAAIEHVDVIRIGTRVPVTLPQRLYDRRLIKLLASAGKVWIQTHFNHPREITTEAAKVCNDLLRAGMPVNNHTVLLKGVNDSLETMRQLMRGLLRIKVRPYYLFHCDPVIGAGHFRTSVWKGLEILEGLRGHISGLGVPTYVVDSPHGGGKIPLMPNYLVSASDDAVVLRNYEGMLVRYQAEDKPPRVQPAQTRGISALMNGNKTVLIPEHNERMARRSLPVLDDLKNDNPWHPNDRDGDPCGKEVLVPWHEDRV